MNLQTPIRVVRALCKRRRFRNASEFFAIVEARLRATNRLLEADFRGRYSVTGRHPEGDFTEN